MTGVTHHLDPYSNLTNDGGRPMMWLVASTYEAFELSRTPLYASLIATEGDTMTDERDNAETWEPMQLRRIGRLTDIVAGGGGKLSIVADDMGDVRKPKGQEGK